MKLDKAIEILGIMHGEIDCGNPDDDLDALKLGIEALKRHRECKDRTRKGMLMPLPGEDV